MLWQLSERNPKSMTTLDAHIKFPQSVELFRFCFHVLKIQHASSKLNDQHLGAILSFTPSETSHWKRGKKCLKQEDYLAKLADNLNIELETLKDIADNFITFEEALIDFNDSKIYESFQTKNSTIDAKKIIQIEEIAQNILCSSVNQDVPVCLKSLFDNFQFIQRIPSDSVPHFATCIRIKPGSYLVRHSKNIQAPYTRLAMSRELCRSLLFAQNEHQLPFNSLFPYTENDIVFLANAVLVPHTQLANEISKVSTRVNLIQSLSKTFCAPKSVIRNRLVVLLGLQKKFNHKDS